MKNIETEIKSKFISLLETRRIDEIDVRLLSNELKITRQTFYYHYKNIYDLIYSIILDEQVEPKENETLEEISNNILDVFFKKEELFKEILDSSAKDILEEMTYSYFYRSFNLYLKSDPRLNLDSRKDVEEIQRICRIFAIAEKQANKHKMLSIKNLATFKLVLSNN